MLVGSEAYVGMMRNRAINTFVIVIVNLLLVYLLGSKGFSACSEICVCFDVIGIVTLVLMCLLVGPGCTLLVHFILIVIVIVIVIIIVLVLVFLPVHPGVFA